jgi:nicotinate phosphoribosyltransferase
MNWVVESLLDTDLYKLTMHQLVLHKFPGAYAKYRFKCRNNVDLVPFKEQIEREFDHLCTLRLTEEEIDYLRNSPHLPFITEDYVNFMEDFRPKRRFIHIDVTDGVLDIWFEGPVLQTMPLEIYALKIVNEVYFRDSFRDPNFKEGIDLLSEKVLIIKDYLGIDPNSHFIEEGVAFDSNPDRLFKLADFGTRRAFSGPWQRTVVEVLKDDLPKDVFVGTSNVKLAMQFGIKPIGSMAHEFIKMFQGLGVCPIGDSQKAAFQSWADEYRGSLGIALSDTLGMGMFLKDFDLYFSKLFDGVRHDSGDPFEFADQIIDHYKGLGIDPMTKTIIFSDGLNVPLAIKIAEHCKHRINVSFGIGTNLTNDLGYEPLQIVIKMVECGMSKDDMRPVAKLSNDPGKTMCEDEGYVQYLRQVIDRRVNS